MNKLTDVARIIVSIFTVGVLLAGLILNGQSEIKREHAPRPGGYRIK